MIDYKQILADKEIINHFNKLPIHDSPNNHGIKHATNVANVMEKLIALLNIEKTESDYLLIAAALHDVGQVYGTDKHYLKGTDFARNYLEDKVDSKWLENIISAIETHHQKDNLNELPLFNHLVLFSDKMDFTNKRLNETTKDVFIKHIIDVNFTISDDTFIVLISSDKKINANMFLYDFAFSDKVINRIKEFAEKLKLECKIFIDEEELEI